MKKVALILIGISIFVIILYFILNSFDINQSKEEYKSSICGNNICEESEESYCLDCNLSCKSELCNPKINVICDNCTEIHKKLLQTLFEHQNLAYDYLADYYGYHPSRLIYHIILQTNISDELCSKKEGCYIGDVGTAYQEGVKQAFIPGLREFGENEITKQENVGFSIHELSHVFTQYGLGIVPIWFSEGISIYSESRLLCHPDYILSDKIDSSLYSYNKLKTGTIVLDDIAPYDEYYKTEHDSHVTGAMYFGALEQDYDCDKNCISKILYSLHKYRDNCTGECFENVKKSIPQIMNLSLNNNDLRVQIITNEIIKQKSEEVTGQNLTYLFNLLKIEYS
ncbi:MAG: hypothetical protein Q8L29_04425 [archaeon]|nr:hypothetical protein [archaeon]